MVKKRKEDDCVLLNLDGKEKEIRGQESKPKKWDVNGLRNQKVVACQNRKEGMRQLLSFILCTTHLYDSPLPQRQRELYCIFQTG